MSRPRLGQPIPLANTEPAQEPVYQLLHPPIPIRHNETDTIDLTDYHPHTITRTLAALTDAQHRDRDQLTHHHQAAENIATRMGRRAAEINYWKDIQAQHRAAHRP